MKIRSIMLLILALLLGATLPMALAVTTTNVYQNFDTNAVGDHPAGWSQGGGGYAVVTNSPFVSSPNSLALINTNSPSMSYAIRTPSPTINSNFAELVQVKYSLYLAQKEAAYNVLLTDFGTRPVFTIAFNNAGVITGMTNGGGTQTIASWVTGLWYHVTLDFIPSNKIYSVNISTNGGLVASLGGLTFAANDRNFEYFYLQTYGATGKDSYGYFDDISVIINPIPEPALGGIVALGVGLLFWHRRRSA